MTDLLGKYIGRYQIIDRLGEGGMASVYKAHDDRLDRDVAIKVIQQDAFPPNLLEKTLKRFEREAKSLAKLSHPNIVRVLDYGEYDGSPYLVMEYLFGGTLKDYLNVRLSWRDAIKMLLPIAHALEYAHEHSIIHRDIKPSNILLTEKNHPMLTDFGVAKMLGTEEGLTMNGTDTGIGLGTPDYMAPEQWNGEASPQSDVYSLGVVLYEMITNHRPYSADTPAAILLKQATQPLPNPRQYVPDLPKKVELFITQALASSSENRIKNMSVFAAGLEKLLDEQDVDDVPSADEESLYPDTEKEIMVDTFTPVKSNVVKKRSNWVPLIGLGGLLLCAVCAAVSFAVYSNFAAPAKPKPTVTATIVEEEPVVSTSTPEIVILPTEAPASTEAVPTEDSLPEQIFDGKGVSMRLVPAGEFIMGSDNADAESKPATSIAVDDFYMDTYEVTNVLYRTCVDQGVCKFPRRDGSSTRASYFEDPQFDNYPVIYVDWNMAKNYCLWREARLPTEAEWEKAARGTEAFTYPWNGILACAFANYVGCAGDTTSVITYEDGKSVYGIYDMSGNVIEWTSSLYRIYPYNKTDGREDPSLSGFRVARGGAWTLFNGSASVRTDTRYKIDPSYFGLSVGFRCAVSP